MKQKPGFTLIESILVITLMGILSFFVAVYIRESAHAFGFLFGQKSLGMASRSVMYRLVREIRQCQQVDFWTNSNFSFRDSQWNLVSYSYDQQVATTELRRNGSIMLANLREQNGINFEYFNENGGVALNANEIRVVRIRLITMSGGNKFEIESAARIRRPF